MMELLQRSLGPGVVVRTRLPARLPAVMADPNQFEVAILNLAVNARDAMAGSGAIVISARTEDVADESPATGLAPGRYVCIAVTDPRLEEHTSELQSLMRISYAGFCLKKKKTQH